MLDDTEELNLQVSYSILFKSCFRATKRFSGKQKFVKFWKTLYRKLQIWAKILENTYRVAFFGKVAHPQPAILSKKCTPLQISFNWFVYILGAPPSK